MTFTIPRRLGIAVFALGVCPVLALAEPGSDLKAGRAWTDPPARDAVVARAEAPKPPETVPQATASVDPSPAVRLTHAAIRTVKAPSVGPAPRVRVASRPAIPRRHFVAAVPRPRMIEREPAFRVVTMRPAAHAATPFARYGYGYVVEAAPTRFPAYDGVRTAQIREAAEAGYLVVRAPGVGFPEGRRPRSYDRLFDGYAND